MKNERSRIATDFVSSETFVASRERGAASALGRPLPPRADDRGLPVSAILVYAALTHGCPL